MGNMSFDLGFVGTLSVTPALLDGARQVLAGLHKTPNELAVAPGCATVLAAAALEISLESKLRLAEMWAARGGRSVGLPHSPDPSAIAKALKRTFWWRVLNVPSVVTAGAVKLGSDQAELLRVIREMITCRNELVHGRGEVLDHRASLEIPAPNAPRPKRERPKKAQNAGLRIRAETVAGPVEFDLLAAKPWGMRWLQVNSEEASRYLDAVETYIDDVLEPLNQSRP